MMSAALTSAGLKDGGCLTLFGGSQSFQVLTLYSLCLIENAALPHGSGTDRALGKNDFVLFDCTANLHGYKSDVTRVRKILGG
jgi:Xaa-Pro aminopeptidase